MAKLRLGRGASCSALVKNLHPRDVVSGVIPNPAKGERLNGLLAVSIDTKRVNSRSQEVVCFNHEKFNVQVYCCKRFALVTKEGPAADIFGTKTTGLEEETPEEPRRSIPAAVLAASQREDIDAVRAEGFDVDDDNEPAPENVPTQDDNNNNPNNSQQWGWEGMCHRRSKNLQEFKPSLSALTGQAIRLLTYFQMWKLLFPFEFLEAVILSNINKNIKGNPVTLGEFVRWIGIWYYMSTFKGNTRAEYWSAKEIDDFDGAPVRFHGWMVKSRFDAILSAIDYTDEKPPNYRDKFHYVRKMIRAWNENMMKVFSPSWVSCLDESMSVWTNKWTCPGWMFVPRKPHPQGNEYHSACCSLCGIMWVIELVEGKDKPKEKQKPEFDNLGKTVGLLLRMCKGIFGRGMVVILDSGFCVLQGLIELRKRGVYASAVIKKRRYWPKHVPGPAMERRMQGKDLFDTDSLHGLLDDVPYDLFIMKDVAYNMKLMATYGRLVPLEDAETKRRQLQQNNERVTQEFQYHEPFESHYRYRHAVDDHNNKRHSDISLEETWVTHRWENRVFSFLLAISEINCYLAYKYFVWEGEEKLTVLKFRKQLAKALIYNDYLKQETIATEQRRQSKRQRDQTGYQLVTAPNHARKFEFGEWNTESTDKYQKYKCRTEGCQHRIRTCCQCSPGTWMCGECHIKLLLCQSTWDTQPLSPESQCNSTW